MCGIAGIISLKGPLPGLAEQVRTMTRVLRHRGPDGEGFLLHDGQSAFPAFDDETPQAIRNSGHPQEPIRSLESGNSQPLLFAFGHRRLSIIDTSAAGHQPITDPLKQIWLVFNGEIYNYPELREQLKNKGHQFRTNTDTEVLLHAWLEWGDECVKHFNGMWAFVLYDARTNQVFASRDRAGVKPFYYFHQDGVFAFASEQKALLRLPYLKTGINKKAAAEFLAGDIQYLERGEENLFSQIYELPPARNFRINLGAGTLQSKSYYVLPVHPSNGNYNEQDFENYRRETEKKIVDSVRLRLRSDVPVGSCLSGGIDSSALVSIMARLVSQGEKVNLGGGLKVFTLTFDDPAIDESKWAGHVVQQTGAEWHKVSPETSELIRDLEELNYAQDIPICSTGTYGQFRLMRKAKEAGIKVILDGQGGDELFGGYPTHALAYWRSMLKKLQLGKFYAESSASPGWGANCKMLIKDSLKYRAGRWMPASMQTTMMQNYFPPLRFVNKELLDQFIRSGSLQQESEVSHSPHLNAALANDFAGARLKMYLKYEDRSSMWHSIEARTPFADDHLLNDWVFSIPGSFKIRNGVYKHLLRESVKDYIPNEIYHRRDKLGFVTPVDRWTAGMKSYFMDLLDDSMKDYINVKAIRSAPEQFFSMDGHANAVRVFRIISFAVWKKKFFL